LISPHDITVSKNGREVYVGELATSPAGALHKFELATRKGKIDLFSSWDFEFFSFLSFRSSY
jgi:hypothetical protein